MVRINKQNHPQNYSQVSTEVHPRKDQN